jgi:hypothetical protein
MSRVKRDWVAERQNWTRSQQKERIMLWFKLRAEKGDFESATSSQIANGLHMISAQKVKEICDEMVEEKSLNCKSIVHRTRKDKSQIIKSVYVPFCMDEWFDAWQEERAAYGMEQLGLFDL